MTRWSGRCGPMVNILSILPLPARSRDILTSSICLFTVSLCGSSLYRRLKIPRASFQQPFLHSQRGLSGKEKMKILSKLENRRLRIRVKRHDTEFGWVNDIPKPTQSDSERPDPVKTPKAETCLPRLSAFETSDCQSETVAVIPPVLRPRMMRPTMNWARVKAED